MRQTCEEDGDIYTRTRLMTGDAGTEKLKKARILIFGAGGVGGYAIEAVARCGVGTIGIADGDTLRPTNLNRQILALRSTMGMNKAEAAKRRIADINPDAAVTAYPFYYRADTYGMIDISSYDYVLDAVDDITAKTEIAVRCRNLSVPEISCMGTGNRMRASFRVTDIYSTKDCPLARVMRRELRKRGIDSLKVVCSENRPDTPAGDTVASIAFVPSAAGLKCAEEMICDILSRP